MPLHLFAQTDLFRRARRDMTTSIDGASRRLLIRALVMVILSALFLSLSPLYLAKVIDAMTAQGHELSHRLLTDALLYLILRFAGQALVDIRWRVIHPVLYAISYAVCTLTASRLAGIFRQEGRAGDPAGVIAEQVSVLSKMELGSISLLYGLLAVIVPTTIELVTVCLAVGVVMGPWLVLYMGLGGILFMVAVSLKRDKELTAAEAANQADNAASASFAEYLSNPSLAREFDADRYMKARLAQAIAASVFKHQRLFSIKTERGLYLTTLTGLVYAIVLFWAVFHANSVLVSAGSFFLLIVYLDKILQPLNNASTAINYIQNGLVSMKGAYTLLQALEKQAERAPLSAQADNAWRKVYISTQRYFQRVTQTWPIGKGLWVRLQGPSGSGKSTYLRRIYRQLLSDAVCSAKEIHYLNPTPLLIRGSVFDNMALGNPSMTRERIQSYWTAWHLDFGNRLIDIETEVEQLSAGESQFLAICRTLIRHPKIVMFDEATNSMDVDSEPKVWAMIRASLPGTTAFVVSHREIATLTFDCEQILGQSPAAVRVA